MYSKVFKYNKEAIWLYAELFSVITITDSHDKIYTHLGYFFHSTKGMVKIKIYITFTPRHGEKSDLHHAMVKSQIITMLW